MEPQVAAVMTTARREGEGSWDKKEKEKERVVLV
jgi:hypothetical protein